jgi:hypothetical protein
VTVAEARLGPCDIRIGRYDLGVTESLAATWTCPEPAAVIVEGICPCGHPRRGRRCDLHGHPDPAGAVHVCKLCAENGHECLVSVLVTWAAR